MAVVYIIRDWNEHFECSQSRKVRKALTWVSVPCKHDGKSFRRLMLMEGGLDIYAAWILIVQIAAKCPTRGILADDDGPLSTMDMAIKTGASQSAFERALQVLCSKEIGWVLVGQWERGGIVLPTPTNQQTGQTVPTNQPPFPPKPPAVAPNAVPEAGGLAGGNVFDSTWEAVAQRLASLGVVQWSQAISDARAAGSDPRRCHELIDFAERNSYGPGAIAKRFAVASPTLGLNTGWPHGDRPETVEERRVQSQLAQRAQRAAEELEQESWRLVKAGRAVGKTDEAIRAECEAAGLPWVNPAKVENRKAVAS